MAQKLKLMSYTIATLSCVLCLSNAAFGQALPDGKGKKEFIDNCTDCHRSEMVTRVKKTPEEWRKSVDEMASRGSQGTKEDLDNVVIYLDTYFSTNSTPATAPQPSTPSSISTGSAMLNPPKAERARLIATEDRHSLLRYLVASPLPSGVVPK